MGSGGGSPLPFAIEVCTMSNKPDKKQIKSNIKQTQQIDSRLQAALAGEREEPAQLRRAAHQFLNARIQTASVVFCEPQLTPAIENQAISRAYRMGQTRDVLVYRLLADETIDERMLEILSAKQKEFDAFAEDSVIGDLQMQSDTSWLTELVQKEQARLAQQES